ncbi:amino acid transporter protein [Rutstroemia sp. NJR-2017a BBW]|nr:amino acid transporter protein [Rutstroemia sp. NJR-2017a BBW]
MDAKESTTHKPDDIMTAEPDRQYRPNDDSMSDVKEAEVLDAYGNEEGAEVQFLAKVGLIGGLITIIGLGIFSTYSGYVLWQFRMRYPQITDYGGIGEVLLGPIGRDVFGAAYIIYSFTSILSAVMITMVALGVSPQAAADAMQATYHPSFPSAFNSISNVVFAYGGHVAWISFISELRNPKEFPKALVLLQTVDISLYFVAALVIYRYAGENVASPALSSNIPLIRKIAWGIALPTIIIAGVIFAHVTVKYAYLRIFARTKHLHSRGWIATGSWVALVVGSWTIAWIIAESIPVFSDLLGFISALFASWFSYGLPGICWFYLNWGSCTRGTKKWLFGRVIIGDM